MMLCPLQKEDQSVSIKLEEEVALTFALRYLNYFAKVRSFTLCAHQRVVY